MREAKPCFHASILLGASICSDFRLPVAETALDLRA